MGILSVTSIFSELAKGVCFALASHFTFICLTHLRCSLHLGVGLDIDNYSCVLNHRVSCLALSECLEISTSFLSFSGCRWK